MKDPDNLFVNSARDMFAMPQALAGQHLALTWSVELGPILMSYLTAQEARVTPLFAGDLVAAEETAALDVALSRLHRYDWVMLTSFAGVDVFANRLMALGIRSEACPHIDMSPLFSLTGRTREFAELPCQLMPNVGTTNEGELELRDLTGKHILLLCAEDLHNSMAASLRRRGADVDEVTAYRIVARPVDAQSLRHILVTSRADAIICTSAVMAEGLLEGLAKLGQHPAEALRAMPLITLDTAAAETLQQAGLNPTTPELATPAGS